MSKLKLYKNPDDNCELERKSFKEIFEVMKAGGDLDKINYSEQKSKTHIYPIYSNGTKLLGLYGYSSLYKLKGEFLTITARGNMGDCFYRNNKFTPIGRLIYLKSEKYHMKYMSYIINNINIVGEQGAIPSLTIPMLKNKILKVHLSYQEQTNIAEILTNQEDLITAKKELLEKYKRQSKYINQELLSGRFRIRLTQESIDYCLNNGLIISKPVEVEVNGEKQTFDTYEIVEGKNDDLEKWLEVDFSSKIEFCLNENYSEEKFFMINEKRPQGWDKVYLGDVTTKVSGLSGKKGSDFLKENTPFDNFKNFITYVSILNNLDISNENMELVKIDNDDTKSNKIKYGDLIFTISSETKEVGLTNVYLNNEENVYLNSFCFGLRLDDFNTLTPKFAKFIFHSKINRQK